MQTEVDTFYICDGCHRKYNTKEEARLCEEAHREEKALENIEIFELKQQHLDLLKETYIGWNDCEFGSPEIDCKRPYGNSNVEEDIAEIIGMKDAYDEDEDEWDEKKLKIINRLHKETQIALQIILHCQSFKLGKYKKIDKYGQEWRYIEGEG